MLHDLHLTVRYAKCHSLNWCVFAGILAGAGIVFFRQAVLKKGYKLLISVGFTLIVMYQYYMYFLIYPDLNIESLYLPNFLKGIGHGVLYISLTIYVAKHILQAFLPVFVRTQLHSYQHCNPSGSSHIEPLDETPATR